MIIINAVEVGKDTVFILKSCPYKPGLNVNFKPSKLASDFRLLEIFAKVIPLSISLTRSVTKCYQPPCPRPALEIKWETLDVHWRLSHMCLNVHYSYTIFF